MFLIHCLVACLVIMAAYSFRRPSESLIREPIWIGVKMAVLVFFMSCYQVFITIFKQFAIRRNKVLTLKIIFSTTVFDVVVFLTATLVFPLYVAGKVSMGPETTNETMCIADNSTVADNSTISFNFFNAKGTTSTVKSAVIMGYLYEVVFILLAFCCILKALEDYDQLKKADFPYDNLKEEPISAKSDNLEKVPLFV